MGAAIKRSKRARRKVAQTRLERIDGISMKINSIGAAQVFDLHHAVAVVRLIGDARSLDGESCKNGSTARFFMKKFSRCARRSSRVSSTSDRPSVVTSNSETNTCAGSVLESFLYAAFGGVDSLQWIVERKCAARANDDFAVH
jgi:hypothetical protein